MKLTFNHSIVEQRKFGAERVNQEMEISVDYNPEDNSISSPEVWLSQNGTRVAEISKLLDKAEGEPLSAMLDAIDWDQLYHDNKTERLKALSYNA